ncbi:MAG: hypothetical protein KA054_00335 [Candidatus Moranbacteria bacterium]|nr:hypothetical protein [Candidatus Moranbacteria bacterium]
MGLTYWFGIRKMLETIRVERDDIQRMLVIRENRNHQLSRLEEYGEQYARIVSDENRFNVLTARDEMIEFVRRLESLAEEGDVAVVLEVREVPKPQKKTKVVVKPVKTDEKEEAKGEVTEVSGDKKEVEKKEKSIIESLPSTTFTYLGLRVIGDTEKVVRYLHKVETLPIALDVVSIEAIRRENPLFLEKEEYRKQASIRQSLVPGVSTEGVSASVPEESDVQEKSVMNAFEVQVTANLAVYHPKE